MILTMLSLKTIGWYQYWFRDFKPWNRSASVRSTTFLLHLVLLVCTNGLRRCCKKNQQQDRQCCCLLRLCGHSLRCNITRGWGLRNPCIGLGRKRQQDSSMMKDVLSWWEFCGEILVILCFLNAPRCCHEPGIVSWSRASHCATNSCRNH